VIVGISGGVARNGVTGSSMFSRSALLPILGCMGVSFTVLRVTLLFGIRLATANGCIDKRRVVLSIGIRRKSRFPAAKTPSKFIAFSPTSVPTIWTCGMPLGIHRSQ